MPSCLSPRIAYQKEDGQKPHFVKSLDYDFYAKINDKNLHYKLLLLPCGKCPNCLANKSLDWTARLLKESEEWKYTYFLTITYDDKHLKDLNKKDIQDWLNRFRVVSGFSFKYYISGEYGETTSRPHYHAIFFLNDELPDLKFYANNLYTCELLTSTWKLGNILVSKDVNERSVKYTIGYTLKKLGETKITLMSKGLGLKYLNEKKENIKFSKGFYLNNGFFMEPPFYFIRKMKESADPEDIKWLDEYENQIVSSKKLDFTIEDLISELLSQKAKSKGKGVF